MHELQEAARALTARNASGKADAADAGAEAARHHREQAAKRKYGPLNAPPWRAKILDSFRP